MAMGIMTGLSYTPYALPAFALCCVVALIAACIAKIANGRIPWRGIWFALAVGGFLSVTLTTDPQASWKDGVRLCSSDINKFPLPGFMVGQQQRLLNTLIAIPMGFTAALFRHPVARWAAGIFACLTPALVEFTQFYVRRINRNCDATDAFDNLTGVIIGLIAASLIVYLVSLVRLTLHRARR